MIEALLVVTSFLMMVGIAVLVVDLGFGGYEETVCILGTTAEQFLFVAALYYLFLRSRSTEKKCVALLYVVPCGHGNCIDCKQGQANTKKN